MLTTLLFLLTACGGQEAKTPATPATPAKTETKAPAPSPAQAPAPVPAAAAATPAVAADSPLLAPEKATETAPASYSAKFETTKGEFTIKVNRDWAPVGADRFYNLVKIGFYDNIAFFRAVDGFMVQFGINGAPEVNAKWREAKIKDDPNKQSNTRGRITFATSGPDSRTTQIFINYANNGNLDGMGFSPFGEVTSGMDVVDSLYKGYGEGAPRGRGPNQMRIQTEGNTYLQAEFPQLDYVKKVTIQ